VLIFLPVFPGCHVILAISKTVTKILIQPKTKTESKTDTLTLTEAVTKTQTLTNNDHI
jgi:hypothetical protein